MLNTNAIKKLPTVSKTQNVPAYLADASGKVLFSFLYNPQGLGFRRNADYSIVNTGGTSVQAAYWLRAQGRSYTIADLLMDGYCDSKDISPAIQELENLLTNPQPVFFTWGSEILGPCVLTDIDVNVDLFVNGKPSRAIYSLSLKEIPKATAPSNERTPVTTRKDLKLTTRQRTEGRELVIKHLKANKNKLSAGLAQAVNVNSFKLLTDDTGNIYTIYGNADTKILVATYDGKTLKIQENI